MSRFFVCLFLTAGSLLFVTSPTPAFGQSIDGEEPVETPLAEHSVFVEGLGSAGLYSLNYDHRFSEDFSLRAGFAIYGGENTSTGAQATIVIVPITANYLAGGENHNFEMGIGPLFGGGSVSDTEYGPLATGGFAGVTSTIGYRYQPSDGGFVFRIGVIPFYSADKFQVWGGLSFGYSF
jgi:hypothetical protein